MNEVRLSKPVFGKPCDTLYRGLPMGVSNRYVGDSPDRVTDPNCSYAQSETEELNNFAKGVYGTLGFMGGGERSGFSILFPRIMVIASSPDFSVAMSIRACSESMAPFD